MDTYEVVQMIASGNVYKTRAYDLLVDNSTDATRSIFKLMLDPSIVYNISAIPALEDTGFYLEERPGVRCFIATDVELVHWVKLLLKWGRRGSALSELVQRIYNSCDRHQREVFTWIIDRQNPANIGVKLVNKIWPMLIYEQLYMGAVPGSDDALNKLPWEGGIMVQVKENGMTIIAEVTPDGTTLRTRNGTDLTPYFPLTRHDASVCAALLNISPTIMLHFEAFVKHEDDLLPREKGNALITSQVTNEITYGGIDGSIYLVLLDYTTFDSTTLGTRYANMQVLPDGHPNFRRVRGSYVTSKELAKHLAKALIRAGQEGVICKHPGKPWTNGKPVWNVKIKHEFEVELRVKKIKPHTKNHTLIGALLCESSDGLLQVSVGSGLSDEQRASDFDEWIGKVVTVRACQITTSASKKLSKSLENPRLVETRFIDKDTADTLPEIEAQYKASKGVQS